MIYALLLLSSSVFSQVLYFDRIHRTCVDRPTKATVNGPFLSFIRPCSKVKLSTIQFEVLQSFPDLEIIFLQGSDLNYSHLKGQKIRNVHLENSFLKQSSIQESKFNIAYFNEADLTGGSIDLSEFRNFSFGGANLKGIRITRSRFVGGDFLRADLRGAFITDSHFEDCVLGPEFQRDVMLVNVTFKNCHEKSN